MLYDYKDDEHIQDVILDSYETLIEDIVNEYTTLRRYQSLYIFAPAYVIKKIIGFLLEDYDDFWMHEESKVELLRNDENEIALTVANDGMLFIECARGKDSRLKYSDEFGVLNYVYDSFKKSDIEELSADEDSILVFGFEDEDYGNKSSCENCPKNSNSKTSSDNDKKIPTTTSTSFDKKEYYVNDKKVDKATYDKAVNEIEEKYLDNIGNMLLNYAEFLDEIHEWRNLLGW